MHIDTLQRYQQHLTNFVHTVENMSRPMDFFVYRTSVPGHGNCTESTTVPLANASEFARLHVPRYQWHLVDGFNNYTKQTFSHLRNYKGKNNWMVLDVNPMTILRPDGHLEPPRDCLHYKLPGPNDYWNHLLYSNLLDIAKLRGIKM